MNKAVLLITLTLLGLSSLASAEETPLWQVHWGKTVWKASSTKLWILTPSGSRELAISKSNLKYLRDEVAEVFDPPHPRKTMCGVRRISVHLWRQKSLRTRSERRFQSSHPA